MSVVHHEPGTDASRLRQRGLRVTGPRLAILAMLEEVGGHRSADELVLALRRAGYHHARTTVYNALDDLARAKLLRAAPVDAGALRYESANDDHHHFVCRGCGLIRNVAVDPGLTHRAMPEIEGAEADELDVVYRGLCNPCAAGTDHNGQHAGHNGQHAGETDHRHEERSNNREEGREPALAGAHNDRAHTRAGGATVAISAARVVDLRTG